MKRTKEKMFVEQKKPTKQRVRTSSRRTLWLLALQALNANAVDKRGLDVFILGPLVQMFECVVDLLLGGADLSKITFVRVLVQILVEGFGDLIGILVNQTPELFQLVTTELDGLGMTGFEGPAAGFGCLQPCREGRE